MADQKVSALTELTAPAVDDELLIVDKSDTSMAASGTDKKIKYQAAIDQAVAGLHPGGLPPTGVTYQNISRYAITANAVTPTSGTLRLGGIWLPAGVTITSISHLSGTTALSLGTSPHYWVALFDSSRNLLRQSNDDTAPAWAANTLKTTNLSSTFVTTYTGLHYTGLLIAMTGGTMVSLIGVAIGSSVLQNLTPSISGNSSTGLTTTAPNPAAAVTAGATNVHYAGAA